MRDVDAYVVWLEFEKETFLYRSLNRTQHFFSRISGIIAFIKRYASALQFSINIFHSMNAFCVDDEHGYRFFHGMTVFFTSVAHCRFAWFLS